jgi:hypothetical protein
MLTLYVAVVAALGSEANDVTRWIAFAIFLPLTPLTVWLLFATQVKSSGKRIPVAVVRWPLWEMAAGTIAFLAWAIALPQTPFAQLPWYSSAIGGVVVLVVTSLLTLIAPLFQNPLST